MFWQKLDPLFAPFRAIRNKFTGVKMVKGSVQTDMARFKNLGAQGQGMLGQGQKLAGQAQGAAGQVQGATAGAQQQVQGAQGFMQPGMPGAPGAPGGAPGGAPINPNPPIVTKGMWFWTKKFCTQCEKQLDKNWFQCPYCAQAAQEQQAAAAAAAKAKVPMKTQAFMIGGGVSSGGASGGGPAGMTSGGMQMIGWLVPLAGAQRGELYTLGSQTTIGTDPANCNLVLGAGQFISSKHAEIKVEAGCWMLKDLQSTNGTYVNDKRVEKQELVDNDLVKFGQCLCRFKSL